jgi:hypothetical protein
MLLILDHTSERRRTEEPEASKGGRRRGRRRRPPVTAAAREHGRGLKKRGGGQCSGSWWPALTVALMMEERARNGSEMGSPPADPPGGRRGVSWKSHAPPVPPDLFTSENVLPPVLIELVHRAGCRSRVGARFGLFDRGQTICRHGVGTRTLEHRRGIFGSPLFLAARSGRSRRAAAPAGGDPAGGAYDPGYPSLG